MTILVARPPFTEATLPNCCDILLGTCGQLRQIDRKSMPNSRCGLNPAYRRTERLAQPELVLLKFTSAVTNTRSARSTGFRSALSPTQPRPIRRANRALVTDAIESYRSRDWLPSEAQPASLRYGSECPQFPHSTPTLHFPRVNLRPKPFWTIGNDLRGFEFHGIALQVIMTNAREIVWAKLPVPALEKGIR